MHSEHVRVRLTAVGSILALFACGDEEAAVQCPAPTLDVAVCDPASGGFTLDIDNPYFPLAVGSRLVLEGEEDGESLRVEIDVLDETEAVAGVTTRVMTETEYVDGQIVEVSRNFFAQSSDGTVCYFGEEVDIYEDGQVVSHDGAWRAGEGENRPGIMMPGNPAAGMAYFQEIAPGIAEDMGEVVSLSASVETPAGAFSNALESHDCNPLDGDADTKFYASGVGIVVDAAARLTSRSP